MLFRYQGNTVYKNVQSVPGFLPRPVCDVDQPALLALRSFLGRATPLALLSACLACNWTTFTFYCIETRLNLPYNVLCCFVIRIFHTSPYLLSTSDKLIKTVFLKTFLVI